MSKLLFWIGVILVLLLVSRLLARHKARQRQQPPLRRGRRAATPPASPQAMVRCAHCGVHLPAGEAIRQQGQNFCSHDHARLGSR